MTRKYKTYMTIDLDAFTELYKQSKSYRVARILKLLVDSIRADNIDPNNLKENDLILKPQNHIEEVFWNLCRERAKKDRQTLESHVESGSLGGRPPISESEKKAAVEDFKNTFGKPTGKYEVRITKDFKLPSHPYFEDYRNQYPSDLLENVEKWLIKTKLGENVEYQWIGKQIQNFNKRKTGKVF